MSRHLSKNDAFSKIVNQAFLNIWSPAQRGLHRCKHQQPHLYSEERLQRPLVSRKRAACCISCTNDKNNTTLKTAAERRYASRSDPPESREGRVPLLHLLLSAPLRRGKTSSVITPARHRRVPGGETQSQHIICQSDSLAGALGCPLKPEVTLRPLTVRRACVCVTSFRNYTDAAASRFWNVLRHGVDFQQTA